MCSVIFLLSLPYGCIGLSIHPFIIISSGHLYVRMYVYLKFIRIIMNGIPASSRPPTYLPTYLHTKSRFSLLIFIASDPLSPSIHPSTYLPTYLARIHTKKPKEREREKQGALPTLPTFPPPHASLVSQFLAMYTSSSSSSSSSSAVVLFSIHLHTKHTHYFHSTSQIYQDPKTFIRTE